MGIMGYDMKESCKLCQSPLCFYYINYEEGIKMCSNELCTYPFSGQEIEILSDEQLQSKMQAAKPQFDYTTSERPVCKTETITKCSTDPTSDEGKESKPYRTEPVDANDVIDCDKHEEKKAMLNASPLDDAQLMKAVKRVHDAHRTRMNRANIIKNPKMLRHLMVANRLAQTSKRGPQLDVGSETPLYKMDVDTSSEGGPVIKIDLSSISQINLTCINDGAGTSSQVF